MKLLKKKQDEKKNKTTEELSHEDNLYAGGFPTPKDRNDHARISKC